MSPFHGKLDIWTSQCSEQPHPFHGKLDTRTSHCSEQPSTGNWTNGHLSVANGFQLYIYRDWYICVLLLNVVEHCLDIVYQISQSDSDEVVTGIGICNIFGTLI